MQIQDALPDIAMKPAEISAHWSEVISDCSLQSSSESKSVEVSMKTKVMEGSQDCPQTILDPPFHPAMNASMIPSQNLEGGDNPGRVGVEGEDKAGVVEMVEGAEAGHEDVVAGQEDGVDVMVKLVHIVLEAVNSNLPLTHNWFPKRQSPSVKWTLNS